MCDQHEEKYLKGVSFKQKNMSQHVGVLFQERDPPPQITPQYVPHQWKGELDFLPIPYTEKALLPQWASVDLAHRHPETRMLWSTLK